MSRAAKSGPPQPRPSRWRWVVTSVGLLVALGFVIVPSLWVTATTSLSYTDFLSEVDKGRVAEVTVDDQGAVTGKLRSGSEFSSRVPVALGTGDLESRLRAKHVAITAKATSGWSGVLAFLPLLLVLGVFFWLSRGARGALAGGAMGFGKSRVKVIEAERPGTRFADVAGYDGVKQEVSEVVEFLRDPAKYAAAGAKGPRGVIMVGPPGTGKTLIGRAVAGEAEVPFLSITGSAFVEMFVGVGAARVRDLFAEARDRAPAIIFIDEIDAVGSRRGIGVGGHEEREQTLNQLLAEMDGFDQSSGIVVLAATNRPESLDLALLRPGRFDRQVTVPLPNQTERAAILAVHAVDKHLDPDVDLDRVARATPGFSGADLANLVNEAAIVAVRAGRTTVTAADLAAARDRVLLGRRETSNALLPEERHAVAVHESGHALLAALCERADPVEKVTILPAGMALGATEQLPEAERHLYGAGYLTDQLTVRLGGRAAEVVVLGEASTGAANDLVTATRLATRMVTEFGLSPALGPVGYPPDEPAFLPGAAGEAPRRPYSEQTQRQIDEEVARLLREAEERAVTLLTRHRAALDRLAAVLVAQETVDGGAVLDALRAEERAAHDDRVPVLGRDR